MTSSSTFNQILSPVNCKYGAPMGRPSKNANNKPTDVRIYDRAVTMSSCGAYDKGGAYWGIGSSQLRVEYTLDRSYVRFYRLSDRIGGKNSITRNTISTYLAAKRKIDNMSDISKAEDFVTRLYNNGLLTAKQFSRLDTYIIDLKIKGDL